jgi:uncharacterized protein YjbI with pentapeptide repeats
MAEKLKKLKGSREHPRQLPLEDDSNLASREDLLSDRFMEEVRFQDLDVSGQRLSAISGSNLLFERVSFANCKISSVHWSDVRLVGCDLSNTVIRSFDVTRVEFIDCKLIGMNALGCKWQDVLLQSCDARFAQLSEGRVRRSEFRETQLREAALNVMDLEGTRLYDVVLRQADLGETRLVDIDLRTCDIEGISLRIEDLRGAIVSAVQAMELVRFLGVVVQ